MRPSLPLLAALIGVALSSDSLAQSREWVSTGNILWDNPANWSPADVPDTANESAVFDRFGTYRSALSDTSPTQVDDLTVDSGSVEFLSAGFGTATLRMAGDTTIGSSLELSNVSLETSGQLTIESAAELLAAEVHVSAASTTIASGSLTEATVFRLSNDATADLGDTTIAASGTLGSRALVDLLTGTKATIGDLQLATGTPGVIGDVTVSAATLTQSPSGVATIGQATPIGGVDCGATCGVLAVSGGGSLNLQSITVHETGSLLNVGGHLEIAGELRVDGGVYEERTGATRTLGAGASLVVAGSGRVTLSDTPLSVNTGQQLTLEETAVIEGEGIVLSGGEVLVVAGSDVHFADGLNNTSGMLTIDAGAVATFGGVYRGAGASGSGMARFSGTLSPGQSPGIATFGGGIEWTTDAEFVAQLAGVASGQYDSIVANGTATLGGELVVELLDPQSFTPNAGDTFTLLTADTISGSFDTASLPTLPAGLGWRLVQRPSSLTLHTVIETGLAGDFNADGRVDAADYTLWRDTLGTAGPLLAADANGDESVDAMDLAVWRANYGSIAGPTAIPEPQALVLFSAGAVLSFGKMVVRWGKSP